MESKQADKGREFDRSAGRKRNGIPAAQDPVQSNKGRFCNNSEIYTLISKRSSVENKAKLSTNKGRFCNNSKTDTNFKAIICREQSETLSTNKVRFCNSSEIDAPISKRLPVENKAKLSQLTRAAFVTIVKWTL